jgi:2-methyl-3-hydroxypyridine 5-carboxylic acid dioxygenase
MTRTLHAEIAGGGYAGLAAAIALKQRGWTVQVHERAPEVRSFGAGLGLWPNGLRVLKALGAYDEVVERGHWAPSYDDRDASDKLMRERPLQKMSFLPITRQNLHVALLNAAIRAGVDIRTSSKAVYATPEGELAFSDGRILKADLVVGADGVGSRVRQSMSPKMQAGRYIYGITRILVPLKPGEITDRHFGNVINYWADDGRRRIIHTPCDPENLYIALIGEVTDPAAIQVPVNRDDWIKAIPCYERFLSRIGDDMYRYDEYRFHKLEKWSYGRVALIGDAAHAMPPTLGMGANSALMGALSLAERVSRAGPDAIDAGLAEWEREDRAIIDAIQGKARSMAEGNNVYQFQMNEGVAEVVGYANHVVVGVPKDAVEVGPVAA